MTRYAWYDPGVSPSRVLGWFDTGVAEYPNLPASTELLELNVNDWNRRLSGSWAVSDGVLVPYVAPEPTLTLAQQAGIALGNGLMITSTNILDIDGRYDCGQTTQSHIQAEMISILINGTFADGTTSIVWPDADGVNHTFPTIDAFRAFATAIGTYVATLLKVVNGTLDTLPPSTVAI